MDKKLYRDELEYLKERMELVANTPFTMYVKILTLMVMNMRYEKVAFRKDLPEHPYVMVLEIVKDAVRFFTALVDVSFIESGVEPLKGEKSSAKETKHQELFDEIWNRYDKNAFRRYIDRYIRRIEINGIEELIREKRCIDLGCGNGNFCFAIVERGAAFCAGIDFGEQSIMFARKYADKNGLKERTDFRCATVYETGYEDSSFDFVIQNGVFHHLDDEDRAIREARRILKKEGWFWYYTDGEGGISYDLWDTSVYILRNVPVLFIENVLKGMNISRDKIVHLMDGLSATYAHTSWEKMTHRLISHGFGEFKRLTGGFDTDFDLDRIQADPYGSEKFGEGDLRILCKLLRK